MKAVVFDLDGTLVDSAPDLHAVANKLLSENDRPLITPDVTRSFIGHGIPNLVLQIMKSQGIDRKNEDRLIRRFKELYSENPSVLSKEYEGVTSLLMELWRQEYTLGVCTNKDESLSRQILEDLKLTRFFKVVVGGDTLSVRKPDPAPLNYTFDCLDATTRLFIGDSEIDAETSIAAQTPFALFAGGYRKREISEIEHSFAFETFADFPKLYGSN